MLQFGSISNPLSSFSNSCGDVQTTTGLTMFISNLIKTITIVAGLAAFLMLIISGVEYITAEGNPEKTAKAWKRIYLSLVGLLIILAATAVAAIVGRLFFGDWGAILSPTF